MLLLKTSFLARNLGSSIHFRKITKESGVGAESERIKLKLTVEVEGVEFDAEGNVFKRFLLQ